MRQRRPTNYELRLDRIQDDEVRDEEERRSILEIFDRGEHGQDRDEDAPLHRDDGE